jgi:RND superfamily putative drug exporter
VISLISHLIRRPRIVLSVAATIAVIGALLGLRLDSALSAGGFSDPRGEALVTRDEVQEAFGDQPNQLMIVLDGGQVLSSEAFDEVTRILDSSGAEDVVTPREQPALASADGRTGIVIGGYAASDSTVQDMVPGLQDQLEQARVAGAVYVTGQPALDYQLNAESKADALRAELIVFPLLLVILLFVFRSVVAMIVPMVLAGAALGVANGIGYLISLVTDISILYTNIVSMIGLAVAVDYSLFIVSRFREETRKGQSSEQAVLTTMATAGRSVVFSGAAVILALSALLVPRVTAFTSIALGGMIVTVVALLLAVFALPVALVLLGSRIDALRIPWPSRPRPTREGVGARRHHSRGRSVLLASSATALLLLGMVPVMGLSLQSPVASADVLPDDDPARIGLELAQDRIGLEGIFPVDVVLSMPNTGDAADAVVQVAVAHRFLVDQGASSAVASIISAGAGDAAAASASGAMSIPAGVDEFWDAGEEVLTARLRVSTAAGPDSVESHDLVDTIRNELPGHLESSTSAAVTGATAQGVDFDETVVRSIPLIAAIVLGLTFVMLAGAFRSVVLPLLALVFNVLVVGASLGLLTLLQDVTTRAPLNSVTPVLLFAVMFGLSMDYLVVILARMRESFHGGMAFDASIDDGARRTRHMVNSAALIMIAVFCSFMTGQISVVREIGIGLAIAVALDALVVRPVLLPHVLKAVGSRAFGVRRL